MLIDRLQTILEKEGQTLSLKERAILKTAISFLDQIDHPVYEAKNYQHRVRLTNEEFDALPSAYWEFVDGQPAPKI
jgi:hypothetical protein